MYQIKLYDKDKTFKKVINSKIIKNNISFTKQINGGLWQFSLLLDLKFDYVWSYVDSEWEIYNITQWDIIEIYNFENKLNTLIYSWYIEEIITNISNFEQLELKINGLASLLKRLVYNVSWNYKTNLSGTSFDILNDIFDFVKIQYPFFSFSWFSPWVNVSIDNNFTDCFDLIKKIVDLNEDCYFYVDNYTIFFKQKPTSATHTFTLADNIVELNVETDTTDTCNYLILEYKTWVSIYQDATSISTYGKREKYVSNTQLADIDSANEFWNNYILKNKNPLEKTSLVINNKYLLNFQLLLEQLTENLNTYTQNLEDFFIYKNIHNIKPWETCKIKNIKRNLNQNLLISKVSYNQYEIKLDLENYDNFIWIIKE